jgi:predicted acylesterase/phospholipase RssA
MASIPTRGPQAITYRCCDLESDQITTLIFGGGGVYGILYLGLVKFCEDQGILKQLKKVIGVSVGSMVSLYLALGYTYPELYKSVMYDIDLYKILEISADNIFNILDQLGINNGAYIEETIKNIIAAKGMSPYLTFRDLNELNVGPQLNLGYTRSFHNDFFMANADTTPDMPVWLAVRASISIPIILTPVMDYNDHDILCDGGLVNNTPIKWYLADWWQHNPVGHLDCNLREKSRQLAKYRDVATQTDEPVPTKVLEPEPTEVLEPVKTPRKYRQHFWCMDIKTLDTSPITCQSDIKSVSLTTYLSWTIHKIFANQDASRDKYTKYLCQLDACDYPEINRVQFDLDIQTCDIIIARTYEEYKKYYNDYLLAANTNHC